MSRHCFFLVPMISTRTVMELWALLPRPACRGLSAACPPFASLRSTVVAPADPCSVLSRVQLLADLWTVARQAPLSLGLSRQKYWSGLPCPPPRGLPNPGIEPRSPTLQADSLPSEPQGKPKNTGVGSLSL